MPWRHLPDWMAHAPEWVRWTLGLVGMLLAAGLGTLAKIADDVKSGGREAFWTRKLYLEVPAVGMMALVGWGVADHYDLSTGAAGALGALLGWVGPKAAEALLAHKFTGRRGR